MKRIFCLLICLFLLIPGALGEGGERFESHFGRYAITLPEGSVHFTLREVADRSGNNTASMRIQEIDCYGISSGDDLRLQSYCTPFTGNFRSTMLADPEGMEQAFLNSYVEMGLPADSLDVRYEVIGDYPFLSIRLTADPDGMAEYYTYGSTGTQFYFLFYDTPADEAREILSTLSLYEPTVVVADYTINNTLGRVRDRLSQPKPDQTITSHTQRYSFTLPADASHLSDADSASVYDISEDIIRRLGMDAYSVKTPEYIDLYSYVTPHKDIHPEDLQTHPADLIAELTNLCVNNGYVATADDVTCGVEAIGGRDFLYAHYISTDGSNIADYYTYDEHGTEFSFTFFNMTEAQEHAILATLVLHEPAQDDSALPAQTVTSRTTRYTITLPGDAIHYTDEETAYMYDIPQSTVRLMGYDTFSVVDKTYIDMYSTITKYTGTYPNDLKNRPEDLLAETKEMYAGWEDMLAETLNCGVESIGERDFLFAHCADTSGRNHSDYYTYDALGIQYAFTFIDMTVEQEHAILATLTLRESSRDSSSISDRARKLRGLQPANEEEAASSPIDAARKRMGGGALNDPSAQPQTRTFTDDDYTIELPAAMYRLSDLETQLNISIDRQLTESQGHSSETWDAIETRGRRFVYYQSLFGTDLICIAVTEIPAVSREELLAETNEVVRDFDEMLVDSDLTPEDFTHEFLSVGDEFFFKLHGLSNGRPFTQLMTVDENGKQYNLVFRNFSEEEVLSIAATFQPTPAEAVAPPAEADSSDAAETASPLDAARNRLGGKATANTQRFEGDCFSIDLPASLIMIPESELDLMIQTAHDTAITEGFSSHLFDTIESHGRQFTIFASPVHARTIELHTADVPDWNRNALQAQSDALGEEFLSYQRESGIDSEDLVYEYVTLGDTLFLRANGNQPYRQIYAEYMTIGKNGKQYNLIFLNYPLVECDAFAATFQPK